MVLPTPAPKPSRYRAATFDRPASQPTPADREAERAELLSLFDRMDDRQRRQLLALARSLK